MKLRSARRPAGLLGLAVAAALAGLAGATLSARADVAAGPASAWRDGAAGYRQAAAEAVRDGRPLLVYFRTDWCPYCRELESELLSSAEVEGYLRRLARARINPESGPEEESLASAYGVSGYPTLFVQRAAGQPPARVSRTARDARGESRLKSPAEFIAAVRQAAEAR